MYDSTSNFILNFCKVGQYFIWWPITCSPHQCFILDQIEVSYKMSPVDFDKLLKTVQWVLKVIPLFKVVKFVYQEFQQEWSCRYDPSSGDQTLIQVKKLK